MFNAFRRLIPPRQPRQPAPARPRLESLEERCVPANFTVSNLNDAGGGSLRQALIDANTTAGADTVVFQAGLTGQITLTTGQLYITDDVNIQGPGATTL